MYPAVFGLCLGLTGWSYRQGLSAIQVQRQARASTWQAATGSCLDALQPDTKILGKLDDGPLDAAAGGAFTTLASAASFLAAPLGMDSDTGLLGKSVTTEVVADTWAPLLSTTRDRFRGSHTMMCNVDLVPLAEWTTDSVFKQICKLAGIPWCP
jgi:hypothetical protein